MNQTTARIKELLDRNLFLTDDVKARILSADEATQKDILQNELEPMDQDQTMMFKKMVKENPSLFEEMTRAGKERLGKG